jgi:UDP-N-acetylmuramate: L-alanyl-gamma-D-glutamyl-meso-diaminopimelate ligase
MKFWNPCYRSENKKSSLLLRLCFYNFQQLNSYFFVIEADEYDSAFFDKRSKFVHYRSRTAVLNNLEFDHADIFDDLAAIQRQFHHLVRTIPGDGLIITPAADKNIQDTLEIGC